MIKDDRKFLIVVNLLNILIRRCLELNVVKRDLSSQLTELERVTKQLLKAKKDSESFNSLRDELVASVYKNIICPRRWAGLPMAQVYISR